MKKILLVLILIAAITAVVMSIKGIVADEGFKKFVSRPFGGGEKGEPLAEEVERLKPELEEKEMLVANLQASLNTAIEENAVMIAEIEDFKRQIAEKDTQIRSFRGQLEFFSDENRRLRGDALAQSDRAEMEKETLIEEKTALEAILSDGGRKSAEIQQSYQSRIEEMKKEIEGLLENNGRLQERLELLNNENLVRDAAKMHYNLAALYIGKKDFVNAVKEYERALELFPEDADSHYNLAIIADIHLQNASLALPHYESYIRLNDSAANKAEVEDRILFLRMKESVKIGPPLTSQPSESVRKGF